MSEETRQAVAEAQAAYEQARADAEASQDALLVAVANGLPDRVDSIARRVAERDMSTTRSLGKERLDAMRADLRQKALTIADDVRQRGRKLDWKGPLNSSLGPGNWEIEQAIKSAFDRRTRERLASPVINTGFGISDRIFTEDELAGVSDVKTEIAAVVSALQALDEAGRTLATKRKADDDADLCDVWS